MATEKIAIHTEYIPLGQFLKLANVIDTGGMVKIFLSEYSVFINGEQDQRRGRKLYVDDVIEIEDIGAFQIVKEQNN
ncbi:S4 domain protein YaaA [Natronobacillus azotifigens]|uniref:S4 domain-containing protein YaaA n=1 Tax=Natronobacillus azotifigens TaxID=472978 RepID=A0A9J6RA67_9BACI|nr:S4 domain-containing protein YaaA [Natronobacillus azotifigens]MCZ0702211.1 S4 domain-containing protein YaaA [Natronobacillus azotifigens]